MAAAFAATAGSAAVRVNASNTAASHYSTHSQISISPSSQFFLALALALHLALILLQRSNMPFDHEKFTEHEKVLAFSVVEMPSKMTGHPPAAREEVAEFGRPGSCGDLEQEQDEEQEQEKEQMPTPICQSVTSLQF